MCMSQTYIYDHVLGTEMHVSGDSGVLFENKAKRMEFNKKMYIINFNVMAI
jgi:hypothetical protein